MSRLIDNSIWNKRSFANLAPEDKLLYLYLETSPETNYYGVFILPPNSVISCRTGITEIKIEKSLNILIANGKICLVGDYLIIFDYFDRQKNNESEKTLKGLQNFEQCLPYEVLSTWTKGKVSPLEGGMEGVSSPHEESKVNKSKINEIENETNKSNLNQIEIKNPCLEILENYNLTFKKNIKSFVAWEDNFKYWLVTYSLEEIGNAVKNMNNPKWWGSKNEPTLDLLFRRSNSKGKCDYINELLNLAGSPQPRIEPSKMESNLDLMNS